MTWHGIIIGSAENEIQALNAHDTRRGNRGTIMNNALKELEQIAQRLDTYMHDHGNSAALETAAEAIADELDERDVTITRVQITLQVDVQHKTKLD